MQFKLGSLVLELAANTARLQSDMGKAVGIAERGASQLKKAFSFASAGVGGGLIASTLVKVIKDAVQFGDELNKAAIKAGTSGKAISQLAYAAKLADIDIASLSTGLKKMQVALSEASTGNKQAKGALDALGISLAQIQRLKPEDQFELIGDRISKLRDPADRARAATELFGKAGADLLPLFEQGAAGIAKARQEAERLGATLGDETIKRLSDVDNAAKRLNAAWEGFAATMTSRVAPSITRVLDALTGTREAELRQQIAFLEKVKGEGFVSINPLGSAGAYKDIGTGIFSAKEGEAMLARLQAQLDLIESSKYGLGGRGRPATVPGFQAADAAEKAAEAAKKASDAALKERERMDDGYRSMILDLNRDIDAIADATLKKDMERQADRLDMADEWYEKWVQSERDLAQFRQDALRNEAKVMEDTLNGAIENWVDAGKHTTREFIKYIGLQLLQLASSKVINSIAGSSSSGSGFNWSGLFSGLFSRSSGSSSVASWIADFAGPMASGGDAQPGKTYLIGEEGPELLRMGARGGHITPNDAIGGRQVTIAPVYHINNPDNTAALPRILRENNRRLVDDLARGGYLVT